MVSEDFNEPAVESEGFQRRKTTENGITIVVEQTGMTEADLGITVCNADKGIADDNLLIIPIQETQAETEALAIQKYESAIEMAKAGKSKDEILDALDSRRYDSQGNQIQ